MGEIKKQHNIRTSELSLKPLIAVNVFNSPSRKTLSPEVKDSDPNKIDYNGITFSISGTTSQKRPFQDLNNMLDEKTGNFIPNTDDTSHKAFNSEQSYDDDKYDWFSNKKMYLNEVTGSFATLDSYVSNDETSDYLINNNTSSDENLPPGSVCQKLDETSGLLSRKRSRKNSGNSNEWIRHKVKKAREKGKSYYSIERTKQSSGYKLRESKRIRKSCDAKKCRQSKVKKCNEIDENTRTMLFNNFWQNQTWDQRKSYVTSLVDRKKIKQHQQLVNHPLYRRNKTLSYHLIVNNKRVQVCKKMFLSTLAMGEWEVLNWVSNSDKFGIPKKKTLAGNDNSLNVLKKNHLTTFLQSLPKMPSHYCRVDSVKEYLEITYRSARDVYRCYEKYAEDSNISKDEMASYEFLLKMMHSMNIGIFKPRKDQCDVCVSYQNQNIPKEDYDKHIKDKDRARKEKDEDKSSAIASKINVFTVDVQAIQLVPFLPAGSLYFKQKLACHQFTIYNVSSSRVLCYVWHEGNGSMGANVFASCILDFLTNELPNIKKIPSIFYSDGCAAQNRNALLTNVLFYFANKYNVTLIQKYLVKGHSQMECDSVHATIEKRKKNREIHSPADYVKIIKESRVAKPYCVKYVDYTFFKDFTKLQTFKSIRPGINKLGQPCVKDLKALKYTKENVMFKLSFDDEWRPIPQKKNGIVSTLENFDSLYKGPIPIPFQKYQDLQSLKNVIHNHDHQFYDNLVHFNK